MVTYGLWPACSVKEASEEIMIQSHKLLSISELSPTEVQRDMGVWGSQGW